MSNSLRPHGLSLPGSSVHGILQGKSPGVGSHSHLLGIFPTQALNPGLQSAGGFFYCLSHQGRDLRLNIKKKLRSWHLIHHFMANRRGTSGSSDRFYFLGLLPTVTAVMKLKDAPWNKSYDKPSQHIKKQTLLC